MNRVRLMFLPLRGVIAAGLLGLIPLVTGAAQARADGPDPATAARPETETENQAVMRALTESWPDRPEWLDMYTDILQGSQLGPEDGWFRRAVVQTRFTWDATLKRYDRDANGRITRAEFPGSDADFARLDRDRDRSLSRADFDFSAHALTSSPGLILFYRADRDGNGKVTPEEFTDFFKRNDSGEQGFLSLSDLQEAFRSPPPPPPSAQPAAQGKGPGEPSKETLIRGLFRQEIGSLQPGPALNERAPDFTLKTNDGKEEVTLSKLIGQKPVVLVFGNFTCGPFRSQAGNVEKLYQQYKDRANFVMIYVREAHPTDGWHMESNDRVGVSLAQPRTYDERVSVARTCGSTLGLGFPMLVDEMSDEVGARYSGMPSRLYAIDREGKVAYKSGRGPFGFKPAELEQSLILLLQEDKSEAPAVENRVALPSDEEAWRALPKVEQGSGQNDPPALPLPYWARALARPLPYTTAAMLELDRTYRDSDALDRKFAAAIRLAVAMKLNCAYGQAYAEADLQREGLELPAIKYLENDRSSLLAADRKALAFAEKLTTAGYTTTDEEVAELVEAFGEPKVVAIVLQVAYANFMDRLALALGLEVEPEGPLPPLPVSFHPFTPAQIPTAHRPSFVNTATAPSDAAAASPSDLEWSLFNYPQIQERLEAQRERKARVSIPTWDEFRAVFPETMFPGLKPFQIRWSLLVSARQPQLGPAWLKCLRTFGTEARQDRVFEESLFWVVTRTLRCFYCMGHCEMLLEAAGQSRDAIASRTARLASDDWSSFPPAERAAFAFARKLTRTPAAVDRKDVDQLVTLFGPERALDVIWWSSRCQFMTKVSDAFQLPLERENVFTDAPAPVKPAEQPPANATP